MGGRRLKYISNLSNPERGGRESLGPKKRVDSKAKITEKKKNLVLEEDQE